jgi:hypothetical protein
MRPTDLDTLAKMLMGAFFIMGMVFGGLISLICLPKLKRDGRKE